MFLEFLGHLLSLDLVWVIQLIFLNLHWAFLFILIVFIFYEKENKLLYFILLVLCMWASIEFTAQIGFVWATTLFLAAFIITRMFVIIFAASYPSLEKKLPLVFTVHFWALLIVMNLLGWA